MPDPVNLAACTLAVGMTNKFVKKYGDDILTSAENTAKHVGNTARDASKQAGKAVDQGLKRDYNAGGITSQLNNNSTQTA